jgi:hypothetical protein
VKARENRTLTDLRVILTASGSSRPTPVDAPVGVVYNGGGGLAPGVERQAFAVE